MAANLRKRGPTLNWIRETRCFGAVLLALAALLAFSLPAQAGPASDQLEFGVTMARRGLWSEALFRFKQAEKLEPSNPRVLNNLAVAYEANGLFEEALEAYQGALKANPGNRDLKENYSRFAEFYQSFKAEPAEASEEEGAATEAEVEDETAAAEGEGDA